MDIMRTGTVLAIVVMTYLIGAAAKLIRIYPRYYGRGWRC